MATYVNDTKPSNTAMIGGGTPIGLALVLTQAGGIADIYSQDTKPTTSYLNDNKPV